MDLWNFRLSNVPTLATIQHRNFLHLNVKMKGILPDSILPYGSGAEDEHFLLSRPKQRDIKENKNC